MFAFCCLVVAVTPVVFDPEHLMLKEDQPEAREATTSVWFCLDLKTSASTNAFHI